VLIVLLRKTKFNSNTILANKETELVKIKLDTIEHRLKKEYYFLSDHLYNSNLGLEKWTKSSYVNKRLPTTIEYLLNSIIKKY